MTIAAYCRVSSCHQKADSQVSEITKWLAPTATTSSRWSGSSTR